MGKNLPKYCTACATGKKKLRCGLGIKVRIFHILKYYNKLFMHKWKDKPKKLTQPLKGRVQKCSWGEKNYPNALKNGLGDDEAKLRFYPNEFRKVGNLSTRCLPITLLERLGNITRHAQKQCKQSRVITVPCPSREI